MARIYTKNMQEVLDPIAESISTLIMQVEDCQVKGSYLSDLSGPAVIVKRACKTLAKDARDMCHGKDEILAKDMPPCADLVDESADNLEEATVLLKTDPKNQTAMRQLSESAKGILSGTTKLLEVYDDSEVRGIVASITTGRKSLEPLRKVEDIPALVKEVKDVSHQLLKIIRAMETRKKSLQEGAHSEEINNEIQTVKKLSPLIVSACKTHIMHKEDENAIICRNGTLQQVLTSLNRMAFLVQLKFFKEEDFFGEGSGETGKTISCLTQGLRDAMLGKHTKDADAQQAIICALDNFLKDCETVAKDCSDQKEKKSILDDVVVCRELQNQFGAAVRKMKANPDDPASQREHAQVAKELYELVGDLSNKISRALARKTDHLLGEGRKHATQAAVAAKDGDTKHAVEYLKSLDNDIADIEGTSKLVSNMSNDPARAHEVREATKGVKEYTPIFAAAVKLSASMPTDKGVSDHLDMIKGEWDRKMDRLDHASDGAINDSHLIAAVVEEGILTDIAAVKAAADAHDMPAYTSKIINLNQHINKMEKLLKHEANQTGVLAEKDTLKNISNAVAVAATAYCTASKDVAQDIDNTDEVAKDVFEKSAQPLIEAVAKAREVLGSKEDLVAIERRELDAVKERQLQKEMELQRREEEAKNEQLKLERENNEKRAREVAEKERVAELERLEKEKMVKLLLEEEEKKQFELNAIGKAAEELHREANQWDEDDNSIISFAKKIAESFNKMAELEGKQNCKRELITLATSISKDARAMAKTAREFAENCADQRLKSALLNRVAVMETIGAQLKIIAAVKASNPEDVDADNQLNICAQNLMGHVQECVGQCHSASIKPVNPNHPLMKTVAWRKKVYLAPSF
eukprot:CFRG1248T1